MYTLYFFPDACSLATQVVLRELDQPFNLVNVQAIDDFKSVTPVGSVPVLTKGDKTYREGAAILLHLLETHANSLFPEDAELRQTAIQNILFANATMHPSYSRLFFTANNITDEKGKDEAFTAAANNINALWQVVEQQLTDTPFLGGNHVSAADILLAVYSRWGAFFPVDIVIGPKTRAMIDHVFSMESFQQSLAAEQDKAVAA